MMDCVGDNTLVQFVEGRLGGAVRDQVEAHLASCSTCRELVSELGKSSVVPLPAATKDATLFSPGELIAGRYEVVRFIASGGMGEVYEAVDRELAGRIAIKVMRPEMTIDPRALDRFKREIHLARKVTHPNVCRIFDFGMHESIPFLTMELLDGPSLAEHLKRVGRVAPKDAVVLVDQLTAALEAAHQAGVVHRDFKPSNVVLIDARSQGYRAVVTDFGVARAFDGDDLGATKTGARGLVGSPAYMAPEQVEGRPAGPPADLYGLGVVLFELVTGTLPFEGETPLMTALMRLEQAPPSPRSRAADVDERWERIIGQCLAREPAERPHSAREVFLAVCSSLIAQTVPPMAGVVAERERSRWPFAVAALAIGLASAGVMLWPRPKPLQPVVVQKVEKPVESHRVEPPKPVSVILRSDPAGAVVMVDDQPVATTPAVVQLVLPHEVSLQLDGYLTAKQLVQASGEIMVPLTRNKSQKRAARHRLLDE
jgi:serine/threonine protein kinase